MASVGERLAKVKPNSPPVGSIVRAALDGDTAKTGIYSKTRIEYQEEFPCATFFASFRGS